MAKKVRFPLEMENEVQVRTMEELRENFSLPKVLSYLKEGKMVVWLRDRYVNDIADAVENLDIQDEELAKKLCEIFEVAYDETTEEELEKAAEREERIQKLRKYTDDKQYEKVIDNVAFDQDELYDLLDEDAETIYLCGERFSIPLAKTGVTYIGINNPVVVIDSKVEVDLNEKGIILQQVTYDESLISLMDDDTIIQSHLNKVSCVTAGNDDDDDETLLAMQKEVKINLSREIRNSIINELRGGLVESPIFSRTINKVFDHVIHDIDEYYFWITDDSVIKEACKVIIFRSMLENHTQCTYKYEIDITDEEVLFEAEDEKAEMELKRGLRREEVIEEKKSQRENFEIILKKIKEKDFEKYGVKTWRQDKWGEKYEVIPVLVRYKGKKMEEIQPNLLLFWDDTDKICFIAEGYNRGNKFGKTKYCFGIYDKKEEQKKIYPLDSSLSESDSRKVLTFQDNKIFRTNYDGTGFKEIYNYKNEDYMTVVTFANGILYYVKNNPDENTKGNILCAYDVNSHMETVLDESITMLVIHKEYMYMLKEEADVYCIYQVDLASKKQIKAAERKKTVKERNTTYNSSFFNKLLGHDFESTFGSGLAKISVENEQLILFEGSEKLLTSKIYSKYGILSKEQYDAWNVNVNR